ncbi:MFS transporter [Simkania sp.]|uniref:MFS transporter n=1 Tax=Simkania sp. TaxID=34094 RepID=UPI003B517DD4
MRPEDQLVEHPRPYYAWLVFILSAIFSGYALTLQFSPRLESFLDQDKHQITQVIYALSVFYYSLALFQIPIGILIDRFGCRLLPSLGIIFCSIGAILMSISETHWGIAIARGIMGFGAAFAFLNGVRIINNWFKSKQFSYLLGIFIALSAFLTVLFTTGFKFLEQVLLWRKAMMSVGLGGLIFACIYFFIVQDAPGGKFSVYSQIKDRKEFWKNIRHVFNASHVWVLGMTIGLMIGPLFAFETIWSVPFLKTVYKAPLAIAIMYNLFFVLGYAGGAIFFGRLSTFVGKRKLFVILGAAVTLIMLIIIIYPPYFGIPITAICFILLGFGASNINVGYTIVHEHNVPQVTTTPIAVVNTFYVLFAAISQSLITVFLELGKQIHNTPEYTTQEYQISLIRLPVYLFIALIFSFFIKETYCKQRQSYEK